MLTDKDIRVGDYVQFLEGSISNRDFTDSIPLWSAAYKVIGTDGPIFLVLDHNSKHWRNLSSAFKGSSQSNPTLEACSATRLACDRAGIRAG